jgi:hypothetical protein
MNIKANAYFLIAASFSLAVSSAVAMLEQRELTEDEKAGVRKAVSDFIVEDLELPQPIMAINEQNNIGLVRFNRFNGYLVQLSAGEISFTVALDNPEVISMYNRKSRILAPVCDTATEKHTGLIGIESARSSAMRFLQYHRRAELVAGLTSSQPRLECMGSELYYKFNWHEKYDENNVAGSLINVTVFVNPVDGAVSTFHCSVSRPPVQPEVDPTRCEQIVDRAKVFGGVARVLKMALFADHQKDGKVGATWAVWMSSDAKSGNEPSADRVVFVDATTGDLLEG